MTSKALEI